jgi:heme/copper-type cytochrome/quinol oxidase subunit 1
MQVIGFVGMALGMLILVAPELAAGGAAAHLWLVFAGLCNRPADSARCFVSALGAVVTAILGPEIPTRDTRQRDFCSV